MLTPPAAATDGRSRYAMLQRLRAYAASALEHEGEQDAVRKRLADWALTWAMSAAGGFRNIAHLLPDGVAGLDESSAARDCSGGW